MSAILAALVRCLSNPWLRWMLVGGVFEVIGTPLLFLLHGIWLMPLFGATALVAELTTLPRFFINDRYVFGHARPTWRRLWQYHVACGGGFVAWYCVTNVLPMFGVHYIIASLCGTACSVGLAVLSNFAWIWRRRSASDSQPSATVGLSLR